MLYGPPGTGKTMLAKTVASNLNCHYMEMDGAKLKDKLYGEGLKILEARFQLAMEMVQSQQ